MNLGKKATTFAGSGFLNGVKKWGKRSGHPVRWVFAFVPVLIDCEY
jgi:hypothetical protein